MCEIGSWKTFDDLEESLTLDDLFLLYETTSERQQRLLKALGAIYGGGSIENKDPVQAPITGESGELLFGYAQGPGG